MSVSTEVQRTLVKSPPELWSELSNPEALARHLADLGAVTITAVEPETKVEWEAKGATGVVHLEQSGWGTRVTLSVTRAAPADEEPSEPETVAEPEPVAMEVEAEAAVEPEPAVEAAPEPERELTAAIVAEFEPAAIVPPHPEPLAAEPGPEPALEPVAGATEPEPVVEPEPKPHPGFFARLFRRRATRLHEVVEAQPSPEAVLEHESPPEVEVVALAAPEPIYPSPPAEPATDLAAELESMEAQMSHETTELLTGVLDRLGAAHHRPFSRG